MVRNHQHIRFFLVLTMSVFWQQIRDEQHFRYNNNNLNEKNTKKQKIKKNWAKKQQQKHKKYKKTTKHQTAANDQDTSSSNNKTPNKPPWLRVSCYSKRKWVLFNLIFSVI